MLFSSISTMSAKACRSSSMAKIKKVLLRISVLGKITVKYLPQQNERTESLLRSKPQQRLRCKS